jgi:hypothetical protein
LGTLLAAFSGVDADTLFIGIAAAFIGLAAEGCSVMKAPSLYLALKVIMLILQKCVKQKFLVAFGVA